jgi:hypothetical protein
VDRATRWAPPSCLGARGRRRRTGMQAGYRWAGDWAVLVGFGHWPNLFSFFFFSSFLYFLFCILDSILNRIIWFAGLLKIYTQVYI